MQTEIISPPLVVGPRRPRLKAAALSLAALAAAGGVMAAGPAGDKVSAVVQAVIDCRAITDDPQRLACYDQAVAAFVDAKKKGDVVVMDREQVANARRSVFGIDFSGMDLFDRGALSAPDQLETSIIELKKVGGGMWLMTVEGGAKWVQVSGRFQTPPKVGDKVVIKRAGVGAYTLSVNGGREVRVGRK